jgi:cytochrome c-type biogenesis protein CcmH
MITFVIVAAAMVAVALVWVLVPLLRRQAATGIAAEASNLAVLRDQRAELDADLANGVLTKEAHEQAVAELTRRAAEDTRANAQATGPIPLAGAWTAAIVAGALPLAAMVLYVALGGHAAITAPAPPAVATGGDSHDLSPQKVAEMAANLAARLEKDPSNAQGWVVLAHTYYSMKRFDDAVKAYERANTLVPDNADLLADYADALGATQNGLQGKPLELVERALKVDPNQWKALALAGTAAFDRQDYKQAVAYWERLRATVPPESQIGKSIAASIAEARSLGGIKDAAPAAAAKPPAGAAASATAAAPPASTTAAAPAKASAAPASGAASIAGTISLSPRLAANAGPDDPVFIFARPAQGPKMPLAVMRKKVRDLPATFSLDDSMAMAPEMKLSNFAEIVVGARVAKSGNAAPQSGDLEGFSQPVKLGAAGVAVVIDTPRP